MTYTESDVRSAIESLIQTAAPNAVVFPWWVLGYQRDVWPGLLRSDADGGKVHGYVITRSMSDGTETGMRCVRRYWSYEIWGFHYYATGNKTSNTDLTFNAEFDAITTAFDDVSTLAASLQRRQPPKWNVDLGVYGGELLHFAVGTITIEAC